MDHEPSGKFRRANVQWDGERCSFSVRAGRERAEQFQIAGERQPREINFKPSFYVRSWMNFGFILARRTEQPAVGSNNAMSIVPPPRLREFLRQA
jgi:hypothetical protein